MSIARRERVATPARLQMEATECGAASLGIILAHYGRWVPLSELREACGVSRDGSNALAIKRAAISYGLEVTAKRVPAAAVRGLDAPLIVFWRANHFLVVEGWSSDQWFLNDPAVGHRTCSDEEFAESFSGILLRPRPGPAFVKGGTRPASLVRRLSGHLTGSRDGVLLIALLGLLLVVPQILVPGIARIVVDWLQGGPPIALPALMGALALAAVLQASLVGLQGAVGMRLATKLAVVLQAQVVARLLWLPSEYHARRGSAALSARALQPTRVAATVSTMFSTIVVGVISSLTAVLIMLATYPPAGAVAIVAVACVVVAMYLASRRRRTLALRMVRDQMEVATVAVTSLGQIEVIKAAGAEDHVSSRWTIAHNRFLAASQQFGERTVWIDLIPGFLITVANAAVTIIGISGVMSGRLTLGSFVAVQTLLGVALAPAAMVVAQLQQAETLAGELDQIDDVLDTPAPTAVACDPDAPVTIAGQLCLSSVTFGYDRNRAPLLDDFDLQLAPGSRVALVGPSGCGKSTVAKLAVGLYEPWDGQVLIDDRPRSWWPERVLHHDVAMVDQDPFIFAGTFRDNITLWDPTIGDAAVIQAAKDAGLHDEIARRPGAYQAVLREGGSDLSGGQRQRLEIARALVRDPALIILDEATSALDAATEAHIDAAIRRRGASCLIVAHRLSTVRDADEIVVLRAGVVEQRGTHDDLIRVDGTYRSLVTA